MNKRILVIFLAWFPLLSLANADELTPDQLKAKATAFIEAKNARQQPDTRVQDIDNFIALLADEFIDEHIKFKVTVTSKEDLRKGMINKLKDEVHFSRIVIDEMLLGHNVAFVKYTESAKVKPSHMDKVVEYTSTHIVSLEFDKQGLIKHIRRHHGI